MHAPRRLSDTHEMYLKALYRVRGERRVARVGELAAALGVSPGTVTGVLKKLKGQGFVDQEPYGVITLTPSGVAAAECTIRRYEILRAVLTDVFGVDADTAAVDACLMEHAASPATVNRMHRMLVERTGDRDLFAPCPECAGAGECRAVSEAAG